MENIYNYAIQPDIVFYFRIPVRIAADRITSGRPKLKHYEAGMDLKISKDAFESYRIFQGRIVDEYESMVDSEKFTVIDATMDIEKQQNITRKHILKILSNKKGWSKNSQPYKCEITA